MRGEEEGKERKLGEVKGWDVGRPYVLGRSAGVGGGGGEGGQRHGERRVEGGG